MDELSHTDNSGNARMVDVSGKQPLKREAAASGFIELQERTLELVRQNEIKKGDVLSAARIAGIQAAKQTSGLIPLCHPLSLTHIEILAQFEERGIRVACTAATIYQTGVEMEALTGVSIALLTIYDMCKAVDKEMLIGDIRLISKTKTELNHE